MIKKNIIIDNLKISYYQSDNFENNNPLVFLHGWKSEAKHFSKILTHCNNFIALDLPGFGSSELPEKDWGLVDYSIFLNNFIKKLNIIEPLLIGHSFGGSLIIKYTAMGFEVKKLILIDSSGIRKKSMKKIIYLILSKIFKLLLFLPIINKYKNKIKKIIYEKIGSTDYLNANELKNIYIKIINEDLTADLSKITKPTDIIWGEKDTDTTPETGRLINKLIKNSRFYLIKGASHWPFIEKSEEFNKIFFSLI